MSWNRKESCPQKTIERIKKILEELGIEINVISEHHYSDFWYSCCIGVKDIVGISVNGKGITKEYAMASAMAEMMERLQNNILLGKFFLQETKVTPNVYREAMNIYSNDWSKYFTKEGLDEWESFIKENGLFCELEEYESIDGRQKKKIPVEFVSYIAGSNGACAGNSREEALAQGLAEIFERYVLKQIYYTETKCSFPDIPNYKLKKLHSYKLIKEIEKQGYKVRVKDLTLGGKLPVLGLLVMDSSKYKYKFSIACDLDIDICLQRCVTETFQGRDIRSTFRRDMNKVLCNSTISESEWEKNKKVEYIKNLMSGEGKVPNKILVSETSSNETLSPFLNSVKDNKYCLEQLIKIAKAMGWDVWFKDNSYLEFPTYRIYINGISDAFVTPDSNIGEEIISIFQSKNLLKRVNTLASLELVKLYELLKKIKQYPRYSLERGGLVEFCGILAGEKNLLCDSLNEMIFLVGHKAKIDINTLINEYSNLLETKEDNIWKNVVRKYAMYSLQGDSSPLFQQLISDLYERNEDEEKYFEIVFPSCNNCESCSIQGLCMRLKVETIKQKIRNKKEALDELG